MDFNDEEVKEFRNEALELLESAEASLLALDKGGAFSSNYDAIFRAFHSIKGASGMMGLTDLQAHMHQLENTFTQCKPAGKLEKVYGDFFLRGVDAARDLLDGKAIQFTYTVGESKVPEKPKVAEPAKAVATPKPAPPAAPAPKPALKAVPAVKPTPNAKQKLGRVLVVDDEPDIVELLKLNLEDAGFEVVGKTDPQQAVKDLATIAPDAVFTDISMPKLTGDQLLAKVHEFDPELPVIYVSGYITKELLINSIASGIYGVIEKPFDDKRVIELAMNATKKYQLTRLLNRTMNFIMYQFSDLDNFLKSQGKEDVRRTMSNELNALLEQRKTLKAHKKRKAA